MLRRQPIEVVLPRLRPFTLADGTVLITNGGFMSWPHRVDWWLP